jgi:hypothetical protein
MHRHPGLTPPYTQICPLGHILLILQGVKYKLVPTYRGYNIGIRLIDEYLAKSKTTKCVNFKDTAENIAKVIAFWNPVLLLCCA